MYNKAEAVLHNVLQAPGAIKELMPWAKAMLVAGHKLVITIKPLTRNAEQNRKLHAMLQDIADQSEWAEKKRNVTAWKRLLIAAWLKAKGEQPDVLPSLDYSGVVVIYEKSSELSVSDCAELITFIEAWGSERGVEWSDVPAAGNH